MAFSILVSSLADLLLCLLNWKGPASADSALLSRFQSGAQRAVEYTASTCSCRQARSWTRRSCIAVLCTSFIVGIDPPDIYAADQSPKIAHVGFLGPESPSTTVRGVGAFGQRLRELGWIEGDNLIVDTGWTEGRSDRLPELLTDILRRKVDVLVTYSTPAAVAAKKATNTVPIVVAGMADPVSSGLAQSLGRPGGNLTGISLGYSEEFSGKWLELLREVVPQLDTVAVISNPHNPADRELRRQLTAMAPKSGVKVGFVEVSTPIAFDKAFQHARQIAQAILVLPDPVTVNHRRRVAEMAIKHRLPSLYVFPDFVDVGGLMSYGVDQNFLFRRAAEFVDMILRGTKPQDIPIEQPTQFSLSVNLKTARALRIVVPESVLLRADEVIK
jgi:putative ABC transport system substrate-binding protein